MDQPHGSKCGFRRVEPAELRVLSLGDNLRFFCNRERGSKQGHPKSEDAGFLEAITEPISFAIVVASPRSFVKAPYRLLQDRLIQTPEE